MPSAPIRFPSGVTRLSEGAVGSSAAESRMEILVPDDFLPIITLCIDNLPDVLYDDDDDDDDVQAAWRSYVYPAQFSREVPLDTNHQHDIERLMKMNMIFRREGKYLTDLQELYLSKAFERDQDSSDHDSDSKITSADYLQMFRGEHDRLQQATDRLTVDLRFTCGAQSMPGHGMLPPTGEECLVEVFEACSRPSETDVMGLSGASRVPRPVVNTWFEGKRKRVENLRKAEEFFFTRDKELWNRRKGRRVAEVKDYNSIPEKDLLKSDDGYLSDSWDEGDSDDWDEDEEL